MSHSKTSAKFVFLSITRVEDMICESRTREEAKENMTTAMRHHLFILLLPEVNKVMLVIIAAYVQLGGKLLKLYCPDSAER